MTSSSSRRPTGLPAESAKHYSLHPLERTLAALVIALLVSQPWMLGGMRVWPQIIACTLAVLAFIVALIPRTITELHHAGGTLRLNMGRKLIRFPFFWLGLLWFALIITQNLNPAWSYESREGGWFLTAIDPVAWLPPGIKGAPFAWMDGWRTLMIHATVWFVVCALWVGITRRKTAQILLTTVALNGVLVAVAVIMQRLTDTKKLLWLWDAPTDYFAAGFPYKNHAGEFLCVIVALCLGLAWWHMRSAERALKKSHPGMVWVLVAVLTLVGQMLTYARAATGIAVIFFVIVALAYGLRMLFFSRGGTHRLVTAASTVLLLILTTVALTQLETDKVWKKFEELKLFEENTSVSVSSRRQATAATLDMAATQPLFGHGAGCFRYIFPEYQQHYQEIWETQRWDGRLKQFVPYQRLVWEFAHNDYAQLWAEFGWVGVGFLAFAVGGVIIAARRAGLTSQVGFLIMLGGPGLVAATAAVDFPFHNPAVLCITAAVITLTLRWAQLSSKR